MISRTYEIPAKASSHRSIPDLKPVHLIPYLHQINIRQPSGGVICGEGFEDPSTAKIQRGDRVSIATYKIRPRCS